MPTFMIIYIYNTLLFLILVTMLYITKSNYCSSYFTWKETRRDSSEATQKMSGAGLESENSLKAMGWSWDRHLATYFLRAHWSPRSGTWKPLKNKDHRIPCKRDHVPRSLPLYLTPGKICHQSLSYKLKEHEVMDLDFSFPEEKEHSFEKWKIAWKSTSMTLKQDCALVNWKSQSRPAARHFK